MKKLPALMLAGAAAAVAGAAIAAAPKTNVMNVPLPDGSVARVEYVGDVAPKVSVQPAPAEDFFAGAFPSFAGFDHMMEQMNRQTAALIQQAQQMSRQAATPGMNVASFGSMPPGTSSVSVVSFSNGGSSCTRTTQVVSDGPGKPPKVTTNVTGNCGTEAGAQPAPAPARLNRT